MFYVTHYAKLLFIWNRIEQKTLTFLISPFKMTRERDSFFTLYIENEKYQIIISYKDLASIFYFNSIANFIAYPINQMVIPWNFWFSSLFDVNKPCKRKKYRSVVSNWHDRNLQHFIGTFIQRYFYGNISSKRMLFSPTYIIVF